MVQTDRMAAMEETGNGADGHAFSFDAPSAGDGPAVEGWTPDGQPPAEGAAAVPDEEAVIAAIATVFDPEIPVNIYELGLIYAIDLHRDGTVRVEMTLTAPNCPSAQELPMQVQEAVRTVPGVTDATVEIVWDPPWDMSRMSDDARLSLNMF
ncbi:SUF system Fe-S cluster assembly protein [Gluconacetobacter takamatsuzukensis]|uniref:SUF system Fe-S cluster assembly protein n=2 Tax=Gluconacetobacter takamatsuzukensis TaxID=1286190 RepID=A0A7W4PPH7_9PROT|nr:SUF system Fe-S cluster assembly protein [Gluconacetobacter takamatsuzukensis]MBB2205223.1 SUF system Fe-S cluster assembly protein [Gluconacetobacter takamatsuzukensis]